jgi:hypothetical protein
MKTYKKGAMLQVLHAVETALPELLKDEAGWNSLLVDYHTPFVERLWREWNGYRIYLHRIHPCEPGEALFHPHPWASAMRVLAGTYEMALGYGTGETEPPIGSLDILYAGSEYEMIDPNDWHYVRPLLVPTMSLMVTDKPWNRLSPKSEKPLNPLAEKPRKEILNFFREEYCDVEC